MGILVAAVLVVGCSFDTWVPPPPPTAETAAERGERVSREGLATAEYAYQAVLRQIGSFADAGIINPEDGPEIAASLTAIKATLDAARTIVLRGDGTELTLSATNAAMAALLTLLQQRGYQIGGGS
jgi:hypothetical protein